MDAQSIKLIGSEDVQDQFSHPLTKRNLRPLYVKQYSRQLDILARIVAYDAVVIDSANANRCQHTNPFLEGVLFATTPSLEIYEQVGANVNIALKTLSNQEEYAAWKLDWFDGADKQYHDDLFRIYPQIAEANSDQSPARALFYLELARMSGKSVFLSPGKKAMFDKLAIVLGSAADALSVTERVADAPFQKAVREHLPTSQSFSMPPLADYILSNAFAQQTSIFHSAQQIRETTEAQEFRKWLMLLEQSMLMEDRGSTVETMRMLKKVEFAASAWSKELDASVGIRYELRTADIAEVPKVGWLYKAFGVDGKYKYRDPIVNAPMNYLAFISHWYES